MTKTLMRLARQRSRLPVGNPDAAPSPVRSKHSFIQWHTEQELQSVSQQLAQIQQVGIRCEADGDFFKSGDLAYQIREIIRATSDLFKKSQRP